MHEELLFPALESESDALALSSGGMRLSYAELARATRHLARALRAAGARPGDRIGVVTEPHPATLVAMAATAAHGFVTVPLDAKLGERELAHVIGDARPVAALAVDPAAIAPRLAGVPLVKASVDTSSAIERAAPRALDAAPLLVLYTSGTTGAPKGAVIPARAVAFDLDALASAWGLTQGDTVVHALPLFHVHGLVLGLFGALRRGGALSWSPRFEPLELARTLAATPSSVLFAVPTMLHRLCEAAEQDAAVARQLASARLTISGSAALPVREHRRIEALTGRAPIERYGLTETLINTSIHAGEERRAGTVGRALDGLELRLVDDARVPIAAADDSTIGEIAVRGPNVFSGYLERPEATAAVLDAEGWFYTGDLATLAPDGYVRIVGRRATDLIKCGGFKVGAGEVEGALLEHARVREVAVLGEADDDLGERIVAFVVADGEVSGRELEDHVARLLSPHKRPRDVRFVDALPRNAMGKVQKARLRGTSGAR